MLSNGVAQCYQGPKVPHKTGFPTLFRGGKESSGPIRSEFLLSYIHATESELLL